MSRRLAKPILSIMCSLILMISIIPTNVTCLAYVKDIKIIINDYQNDFEIKQNETLNITIIGLVHCEMYGITDVIVSLMTDDTLHCAVIEPDSIYFTTSGIHDEQFVVYVQPLPLEEGEYAERIIVSGRAVAYPTTIVYQIDPVEISLTINVINETTNDISGAKTEDNRGFMEENGMLLFITSIGVVIGAIFVIWIIRRKKVIGMYPKK